MSTTSSESVVSSGVPNPVLVPKNDSKPAGVRIHSGTTIAAPHGSA